MIQLISYEALAYNIVAFMRDGVLHLSRVLYVSKLEASGDGHLRAESWIAGKRNDHVYEIQGTKVVELKARKKRN